MKLLWRLFFVLSISAASTIMYGQDTPVEPSEIGRARIAKLTFEPPTPRTGDRLKLQIKLGEETVRADVRWAVNGEEVERYDYLETAPHIELERPIKAGDNIEVTVTPYDHQEVRGKTIVEKVFVNNSPPSIQLGEQKIAEKVYRAQVHASDPEDEVASLTLEQGPPGMSIDKNGVITWKLSDNTAGTFNVRVSAKDKHGAEAILTYSFTIRRSGP